MTFPIGGFDWDEGNRGKCTKHGVSLAQIEAAFREGPIVGPDVKHSQREERHWAIAKTDRERWIFLVFTFREREGKALIRPIGARFMHAKEVKAYEKENPGLQKR